MCYNEHIMSTSLFLLGGLALLVMYLVATYNSFITLRNRVKEAWSDIDVQLKRRYDLIPNLVETVKGYAKHEESVLESVIKARAMAIGAQSVDQHAQAENALSGALKNLFAVAEAYPDLKASANFVELQRELTDTEDKIQASRRFYNANVRDLNTKIEHFPSNLIANTFGFKAEAFFELSDQKERENVKVSF